MATSASNDAAPGTLGFIVVFGLAVILVFVFRSMSKHIRKVNDAARRAETVSADESGRVADDVPGSAMKVSQTPELPEPRTEPVSGRRPAD
jgi:Na+-transporting methylmalonyl-CoA/oxaloacetate decarboxylase gamma subunit